MKRSEMAPATSARLRAAALDAFAAKGFHAATTRDIAERANLSPAAVYVHFKAKTDILYALAEFGHADILAHVTCALDAAGEGPRDRVLAYIRAFASWHAENNKLARVIAYEIKSLTPEQYDVIVNSREAFAEIFERELRRGTDAGVFDILDLRYTTLAALSLCLDLARWFRPHPEYTADEIGGLYADLVLRMLGDGIGGCGTEIGGSAAPVEPPATRKRSPAKRTTKG
ncbi:TetR/AcrR family transcriptional regulator [Mycobacterium sp. NPDC003323]